MSDDRETLRVKSIPALPDGFALLYGCKHHPERVSVSPIACRLCAQCWQDAVNHYAQAMVKHDQLERMEGHEHHGHQRYEDRTDTHLQPKRKPKV